MFSSQNFTLFASNLTLVLELKKLKALENFEVVTELMVGLGIGRVKFTQAQ